MPLQTGLSTRSESQNTPKGPKDLIKSSHVSVSILFSWHTRKVNSEFAGLSTRTYKASGYIYLLLQHSVLQYRALWTEWFFCSQSNFLKTPKSCNQGVDKMSDLPDLLFFMKEAKRRWQQRLSLQERPLFFALLS